jgi:hypothetical protein
MDKQNQGNHNNKTHKAIDGFSLSSSRFFKSYSSLGNKCVKNAFTQPLAPYNTSPNHKIDRNALTNHKVFLIYFRLSVPLTTGFSP